MPSAGAVSAPTIVPLRVRQSGKSSSQIDTNTLIEITAGEFQVLVRLKGMVVTKRLKGMVVTKRLKGITSRRISAVAVVLLRAQYHKQVNSASPYDTNYCSIYTLKQKYLEGKTGAH